MFGIKTKKTNKKIENKEKRGHIFVGLIPADEKEYFIENLSMLLSSGMDILMALESINKEIKSPQMRKIIENMQEDVEAGFPVWKVLSETGLFPSFIVSLIKIGEKSGGLVKNLKMIAIQQKKDRSFNSKIRSAMMYPVFVLVLTLVVGIGIAWFILPRLTVVFDQLKVELPLITKILIYFGKFIAEHGSVAVPIFVFSLAFFVYFVFIFSRTKFIGQTILFFVPGIGKLVQETELARMGFILGTLLRAGLPIVDAIDSLVEASSFYRYKNLYIFFKESISDGTTFQQSFEAQKNGGKLIPSTVQQMIIVGEKSGHLSETFLAIGENFEEKIENTSKNLATILEPVLLVIVWLGVVSVALAVILPIYSLIGGLNSPTSSNSTTFSPAVVETMTTPEQEMIKEEDEKQEETTIEKKIEIIKTETGYLNVRKSPTVKSVLVGKLYAGDLVSYAQEEKNWFQVVLPDGQEGWVSGDYVKKINDDEKQIQ